MQTYSLTASHCAFAFPFGLLSTHSLECGVDLLGGCGQTAVQVDLVPSIDGLPIPLCKPPRAISIGFFTSQDASNARVRCAIILANSSICSPAAEAAHASCRFQLSSIMGSCRCIIGRLARTDVCTLRRRQRHDLLASGT